MSTNWNSPTSRVYQRDERLLNVDALMQAGGLQMPDQDRAWFKRVNEAVRQWMNGPGYDCSHDYEHVVRVTKNAHRLWIASKDEPWAVNVKPLVIYTAALCHDIGDSKYATVGSKTAAPSGEPERQLTSQEKRSRQYKGLREFLDDLECPSEIADPAAHIASLVSFTCERDDPESVQVAIEKHPELRFVQDGDRLDALGPMGLARCAAFGMLTFRRNNTIMTLMDVCDDRFKHYPGLMKTPQGRKEAEMAWAYMLAFQKGMFEQADCEAILQNE